MHNTVSELESELESEKPQIGESKSEERSGGFRNTRDERATVEQSHFLSATQASHL